MILDDLKGKRVLVTGGSSGIGAAVAKSFAAHGSAVAVHYFSGADAAKKLVADIAAAGGKAVAVGGDVRNLKQAAAVVEEAARSLGGIDVLVNNAGGMVKAVRVADDWDQVYDEVGNLNVRSILAVTRAALPYLKKSGHGAIINTGSIAGRNGGAAGSVLYAASKAAVHSMTKSMATELAPDGIRVNAVAPGLILTPFHANTAKERLESVRASIPLKRLGTAEECVGACLFLASENMSGYVTGIVVDVNGGRLMP